MHELELADGLAELLPVVDVGDHDIKAGLHNAGRPGREHGALIVEAAHQDARTGAHRAHDVFFRYFAIVEHQFAGFRAAHAKLVEFLGNLEALEAALDEEGGDAFRAGVHVGLGVDDQSVRIRSIRDPHLGAIQDVTVAFPVGAQFHRDDVRTGPALAHGERAEMLAGDEFRQVPGLLVVIAPAPQLVDAEVRVGAVGKAHRSRSAGDFLHRHDMLEIAETRAAPFLFDRDAKQAELAHLRQQVARKPVRPVDLGGAGRNLVAGKVFHGFADHVRGFTEIEVQRGISVRNHAAYLARAPLPVTACQS